MSSTDETREIFLLDHADRATPTRCHELDHTGTDLSF